jgi:hypothetical protein
MSKRPTVAPEFVAAMIEATPERVRRRLDRAPGTAVSWHWRASERAWSVDTGAETVTLPHGHVAAAAQLACTCLLSPNCFHVLACLTCLDVVVLDSPGGQDTQPVESPSPDAGEDFVEPGAKQQQSAGELVDSIAQLLRVGVASAGVVVQSGLLRASHQCRAEGLHRLAALGLRVITGAREFRSRAAASDPAQLAEDIADLLETGRHVLSHKAVPGFWIGTARRQQAPVRPRKLHGLFAEPIITRSGFSGAAVYFLGEDDRIYTASDVRLGDAQHARDAYLGGIEIGPMIQPAKQLARGLYVGTDLTASQEGRLGRGKSIKIVEQGQSTWQGPSIQARFQRSLPDQWKTLYAQAALPADAWPVGWDFVFACGTILGAAGPDLLFQPVMDAQPIRLAIASESESLYFRENLRMLSHAPGLRMQVIARVNLEEPRILSPLALAPLEVDLRNDHEPRLDVPGPWAGRVCLGFDEIQRHFLINAQAAPVVLTAHTVPSETPNPLASLRRRWIATMLAGVASERRSNANILALEIAALSGSGFATGAGLLDALSRSPSMGGPSGIDVFLATAVYLRSCSYELARSMATLGI